ncbi:hypothetical protein SELMODRAFT_404555 [Selaginella moellendorffii]|uniref:Uncharacterized protein n=1 Tax=Selaginella moellendorffii TaxID=88036 RepID=D8QVQ1_SELML|nr:hypothetical protein SELMODRAFT_404555 [Selaginella moellendorffii]
MACRHDAAVKTNFDEELDKQGRNLFQNGASTLAGKKSIPEWSALTKPPYSSNNSQANGSWDTRRMYTLTQLAGRYENAAIKGKCTFSLCSSFRHHHYRPQKLFCCYWGHANTAAWESRALLHAGSDSFESGLRRDTVVDTSVRPASQIDTQSLSILMDDGNLELVSTTCYFARLAAISTSRKQAWLRPNTKDGVHEE